MSDFDYKAMAAYMEKDKIERDQEAATVAACKEFLEAHGYVICRKDEVAANTQKLAKTICDSIDDRLKQPKPDKGDEPGDLLKAYREFKNELYLTRADDAMNAAGHLLHGLW